nr:uncharacterized protein LOC113804887 [Penaeus vannamei]
MQRCIKVVDDILLYDDDFKTLIQQVDQMLCRCHKNGITLNRDKFVIAALSVSFCGYTISDKAANVTDLGSFMGLVNQLSEFTRSIAATAQTPHPLLSPKCTFVWTADYDEAFQHVKKALSHPLVLANRATNRRLSTLPYRLCPITGSWPAMLHLVRCGSRFLTKLEMLADVWVTAKCKSYLIGVPNFILMTDHRPLILILNKYTLDAVENPRLQHLKGHISPSQFIAVWGAGKQLATHLRSIVTCNTIGTITDPKNQDADRTLQELRKASVDTEYACLKDGMTTGFPSNRYDLHKSLLPYWKIRDSLSADGELVLYGQRIVIPTVYRRCTLIQLHASHRGIEAMKRRARQTVFWPGIDIDIKSTVEACQPCQVVQPSQQQEPMQNDDHPTRPFESVSADFFTTVDLSSQFSHAKAAVKSTKYLIMKTAPSGNIDNEDFDRGLLELRNIPNATGRSPAQILYGRPLCPYVLALPESFSQESQEKSGD